MWDPPQDRRSLQLMPAGPRRSSLPLHQGGPLPEGQGPHLPWAGLPSGGGPDSQCRTRASNAGRCSGDCTQTGAARRGTLCTHTTYVRTDTRTHSHTPGGPPQARIPDVS